MTAFSSEIILVRKSATANLTKQWRKSPEDIWRRGTGPFCRCGCHMWRDLMWNMRGNEGKRLVIEMLSHLKLLGKARRGQLCLTKVRETVAFVRNRSLFSKLRCIHFNNCQSFQILPYRNHFRKRPEKHRKQTGKKRELFPEKSNIF